MKFLLLISAVFILNSSSFAFNGFFLSDTTHPKDSPDSILTDTSSIATDSVDKTVRIDTLIPLYSEPLTDRSYLYLNRELYRNDYKSASDFFRIFPLAYQRRLSHIAQPEELSLYGAGFNQISYYDDGVLINNRYANSLNLNFVQSEDIQFIEIIPTPRSFLYSSFNNSAAVNFIEKDLISRPAYTRIRYYEGPFEQAMIDAQFSTMVFDKLNLYVDITNRKAADRYENSAVSLWQGKLKLKYFLSNKFNIIGSYSYLKYDAGINGGVMIDSIPTRYPDEELTTVLYDEFLAPVHHLEKYQKETWHNLKLQILSTLFFGNLTDITLYSKYSRNEFRNNENDTVLTNRLKINRTYNVLGANIKQIFNVGPFRLDAAGNAERVIYEKNSRELSNSTNFSLSGVLTGNFISNSISPAFFIKTGSFYEQFYSGLGADLVFRLGRGLTLYGGISNYEYLDINNPADKILTQAIEASLVFNIGNLHLEALGFYRHMEDQPVLGIAPGEFRGESTISVHQNPENNITGIGLTLNYNFYFIYLETTSTLMLKKVKSSDYNAQPVVKLDYGLFYKDTLFNNALDLKAGFDFRFYTQQTFSEYDFYNYRVLYTPAQGHTKSNYQIDFFVAGTIQQVATIYFAWENILNNEYYLVPYYPVPERGIRFGIAWELWN